LSGPACLYLKKNAMRIFALVLTLTGLVLSCTSQKKLSQPDLTGGSEDLYRYQWNLTTLGGKEVGETKAKLLFSPGEKSKVTGNTGCNVMNGTMELKEGHGMTFSPLAVTRMACPGNETEQPFLKAFEQVTNWSIKDNVMSLYSGSTVLATFKGADVSGTLPEAFKGTWELEYITGPRIAFDGLYPDKKPVLIYEGGDEYKGNTSCNGMGGKLVTSATGIQFKPPISTMMACPGNGEQTFLKTLAMVDGYAIDNGKLLLKSKGVDIMRFVKK
jgi:heat shock protein HslJ